MSTQAERIRAGMAMKGILSPADLADRVGATRQYICKLLDGKVETDSFKLLTAMGREFGVAATWLATGEGSPSPRPELTPAELRLMSLFRSSPGLAAVECMLAVKSK